MVITLPLEIEEALEQEAREQGMTAELLALDSLRQRFVAPKTENIQTSGETGTLYNFLADHIGVINSNEFIPGGAQMSRDMGRRFAEGMQEKRKQQGR